MKFIVPSYYDEFECIAEKCTDNCCIGWEIGIDEDTAAYYRSLKGTFGDRLRANIAGDDTFILQNERCPFLNNQNLCDIIIHCGKDHLCQICRDHPRYFEWYGDVKEGGLGLSCEEAARLILSTDCVSLHEKQTDEEIDDIDEDLFADLCTFRETLFSVLENGQKTLSERLCEILLLAEQKQFVLDNPQLSDVQYVLPESETDTNVICDLVDLFADFEPIDSAWTVNLQAMQNRKNDSLQAIEKREEQYIVNLCRYFLWRYLLKGVFDGEIVSKVKLAVVSPLVIRLLCGEDTSFATWIEKSKLYSKQMEYSDENRELFYDYTYEKACLETPQLCRIAELLL